MMNENKKIAYNSVIIFLRLIITSVVGIVASRIVLDALGASDFGLYNVVGGIVVLLNVVNTAMLSTTYRYLAFEIGKKENGLPNKVFNASLLVHCCFALFIIIFGLTVGEWYVNNILNVDAYKLPDARFVFHVSLLTTAFSTVLVPYQGLLVAYEKFSVNAVIDIVSCLIRLFVLFLFIYQDVNRLRLYSIIMFCYTVLAGLMYLIYCYRNYNVVIKLKIYKQVALIREMMSFALWTLFGAVSSIGKTQGSAMIINFFFGTTVNAAYAVANQIESFILMFARSLNNAAIPQITKNYSSGNQDRSILLTSYISKYTYLLMSLVAFPVLLEMDFLLGLWLKEVPDSATEFCKLMVLGGLIGCLGEGIPALVNATGNIKVYQIIFHTFNLFGLPIAFVFYKIGSNPYVILEVYCVIYFLSAILRLFLLKYLYKFDINFLINNSYVRIFAVTIPLAIYYYFYNTDGMDVKYHIIYGILSELFLLFVIAVLGTDKNERNKILGYVNARLKRK